MKQDKGDFMLEFFEWQMRNKQTLTFWIILSIVALSLFTIGFIIYFQFFWEPKEIVDPFWINISNLTA